MEMTKTLKNQNGEDTRREMHGLGIMHAEFCRPRGII